jgi:hypothetical protein
MPPPRPSSRFVTVTVAGPSSGKSLPAGSIVMIGGLLRPVLTHRRSSVVPLATETVTCSSLPETLIPGAPAPSHSPCTSHLPSILGQASAAPALTRASAWDGSGNAASAVASTTSFFKRALSPLLFVPPSTADYAL